MLVWENVFAETKQDVIFVCSICIYLYAYNRARCKDKVVFFGAVLEEANVISFLRLVHLLHV